MNTTLLKLLKQEEILKFGEFVLRNGEKSDYYCDIKKALGNLDILNLLVKELVEIVPPNTTCIAGSGYGGITLASLVAYKKKLPLVLVRDRIKDHGTKSSIDAYMPSRSDTICIVDDVFTKGTSINDTKQKLLKTRAKFSKPLVVLNRSNNKSVISLLSYRDLK